MAFRIFTVFLISCASSLDSDFEIEDDLFAEIAADGRFELEPSATALSLLQTAAVLHRQQKVNLSSVTDYSKQKPLAQQGRLESEQSVVAHKDNVELAEPVSLLQLDSAVSKETKTEDDQQTENTESQDVDKPELGALGDTPDTDPTTSTQNHPEAKVRENRWVVMSDDDIADVAETKSTYNRQGTSSEDILADLSDVYMHGEKDSLNSIVWIFILCVAALTFIVGLCSVTCSTSKQSRNECAGRSAERAQVETLPVCKATEVKEKLPQDLGYDCMLSRPRSSRQSVRIEGRVEGLTDGCTLVSPMTQQSCVRFSAATYRQEQDGMRPHPIAVYSAGVPFVVSLRDDPDLKILVQSDEVAFFDMKEGYHSSRQTFVSAPQRWKDFVLDCHVGDSQSIHSLDSCTDALEFRESALLIGSHVTLSGELLRDPTGRLQLQGWTPPAAKSAEPWRTSWEQSGLSERCKTSSSITTEALLVDTSCSILGKVLVSDDPSLLSPSPCARPWLQWLGRCFSRQRIVLATQSAEASSQECGENVNIEERGVPPLSSEEGERAASSSLKWLPT